MSPAQFPRSTRPNPTKERGPEKASSLRRIPNQFAPTWSSRPNQFEPILSSRLNDLLRGMEGGTRRKRQACSGAIVSSAFTVCFIGLCS